jgi:hypothetical protein
MKRAAGFGRWRFGLSVGLLWLAASGARADDRVVPEARIESVRGIALGSGARATSASTHAHADNAANLIVGGLYHLETFMTYVPGLKRLAWGGAVVDSMTSKLAAGVSARMLFGEGDAGENSGWEGRLSLAFPLGDMLSLGVSGRYANFTLSDDLAVPEGQRMGEPQVAGQTGAPDQTFKLKAFTLDAALTLRPIESLSISALGYNLIDTESPLAPLMVGGSVGLRVADQLMLGGDVLADLNTHDSFDGTKLVLGGGLEFLASGVVPLRGGYQFDQGRKQHAVTGGVGFVDTRFGLQVGLRQVVAGGKETHVMAALQYFVQ